MKNFYDYLDELEDDMILDDEKFRQLEMEQKRLKKIAAQEGIPVEDLYEEFFKHFRKANGLESKVYDDKYDTYELGRGLYEDDHEMIVENYTDADRYGSFDSDRNYASEREYDRRNVRNRDREYDRRNVRNRDREYDRGNMRSRDRERAYARERAYDTDQASGSPKRSGKRVEQRKRYAEYDRRQEEKRKNKSRGDLGSDRNYRRRRRRKTPFGGLIKFLLIILGIILLLMLWKYLYLDHRNIGSVEKGYNTGLRYTNIALFGLDSRNGEMDEGVRADTIIIASVDNLTHKVKMVSVLRDSFLQMKDGSYTKVNSAYSYGGAKEALEVLNKNLDLDITNYAVINFEAMIRAVDAVGGVDIELTSDEVYYLNGYQAETAKSCGMESEVFDLPETDGVQHLNGVQATAYCRIRYVGTDIARTQRQRIILTSLMSAIKKKPWKLNTLIDETFPYISTNMSYPRFASLGLFAPFYSVEDNGSFPFETYDTDNVPGYEASFIIPYDLPKNVTELHEMLFNSSHTPTETVQSIGGDITDMMGY